MLIRAALGAAALVVAASRGAEPVGHDGALLAGALLLVFWVTAALGLGWRITCWLEPQERGSAALLRCVLHSFCFVVVLMAVAGALGMLAVLPLTVASALAFLIAGPPELAGLGHIEPREFVRAAKQHPVLALTVAVAALVLAVDTGWSVLMPSIFLDDYAYHLASPVGWIQRGNLDYQVSAFGNHSPPYYPMATELLFAWAILPLGELGAARLLSAPLLAMGVLAVYVLLRQLGGSTRACIGAASLAACRPIAVQFLGSNYVDVAFSGIFVASVLMLLRLRQRPSAGRVYELGLVVGLLLGVKVLGALMAALVLLPVAMVVLAPIARDAVRRTWRGILAGLVVLFAAGGWWYLRNFFWSGNPVFPLIVELGGIDIFDGAYDRSDLPSSSTVAVLRQFLPDGGGWLSTLPLVPFALAIVGVLASLRARKLPRGALLVGLLLPGWIAIVYLQFCPWPYPRFIQMVGLFACALLVPALDGPRPLARLTELSVLGYIAFGLLLPIKQWDLFLPRTFPGLAMTPLTLVGTAIGAATVFSMVALVVLRLRGASLALLRGAALILALGLILIMSRTSDPASEYAVEQVRERWAPYVFIEQNCGPSRIALAGSTKTLLAQGWKGLNHVEYVHVDDGPRAFHDRVSELASNRDALRGDRTGYSYYRADPNRKAWHRNLVEFGADLLVCVRLPSWILAKKSYRVVKGGFSVEKAWADRDPESFELIFSNKDVRVYAISL